MSVPYHQQVHKHLLEAASSTEEQGAGGKQSRLPPCIQAPLSSKNHIWLGFFNKIHPAAMHFLKGEPSAGKGLVGKENKHSRCAPAGTQRGLLVCVQLLALAVGMDRERSSQPVMEYPPAGLEQGRDCAAFVDAGQMENNPPKAPPSLTDLPSSPVLHFPKPFWPTGHGHLSKPHIKMSHGHSVSHPSKPGGRK